MNGLRWDQGGNQKVPGNKWKWTHNNPELMGHSKGSPVREVYSDTGLPKKNRDSSNKQPNRTPTRTWGTTTKTTQRKYKEGNNQDQSRIKWYRDWKHNSKD